MRVVNDTERIAGRVQDGRGLNIAADFLDGIVRFCAEFKKALASGRTSVIEVASSLDGNLASHRAIEAEIEKALRS